MVFLYNYNPMFKDARIHATSNKTCKNCYAFFLIVNFDIMKKENHANYLCYFKLVLLFS